MYGVMLLCSIPVLEVQVKQQVVNARIDRFFCVTPFAQPANRLLTNLNHVAAIVTGGEAVVPPSNCLPLSLFALEQAEVRRGPAISAHEAPV
jgi:hypothetical protein